ncbi:hypothetical protein V490_04240 [Pseudogymnoascus sp. VKM F-3557]|nr:hypothetical protein V490_04240 [Pseudogymnoascus sp. VKM F-3557]
MPPIKILPLPYLLAVHLLTRDTPNDTTGEVPNIEPEPVKPYKYPSWAFGIGTLVVFGMCIFFAFACAGINRHLNRKVALRAEFPTLGAKMGLVSCLATSTSAAAAAFVMPGQASEIGTLPPEMVEQKRVVNLKAVKIKVQEIKMPAALPRAFRKLGRMRARGEDVSTDVELIQLSSVKGRSGLVPRSAGWMMDKQGVWIWEGKSGGDNKADLAAEGDHVLVEAYRARDEEDSIGFVTTEERFENVDPK